MSRMLSVGVVMGFAAAAAMGAEGAGPNPVERLVPANAVALLQAADLSRLRAAYEQSALAEAARASRLLSYLGTVAGAGLELGAALVSGLPPDELSACLGQHAGLVVLDFRDAAELRQRVPIVLLVEVADQKKLEGVLDAQLELFSLLRQDIAVTKAEHAGAAVRELALPNGAAIAYAFRDGVLAAGGREGVRSLLDALAADKSRIADAPRYQAVRQKLEGAAALSLYVDVRALLDKTRLADAPQAMQRLRAIGVASVQAAGLAVDFDGRQLRERLFVSLDEAPSGLLRALTAGQPITPAAAQFVPADFSLVATVGLSDTGLWDRLRTMLMEVQGVAAADFLDAAGAHIEKQLGIHPKTDIADLLKGELSVALDLRQLPAFYGSGHQPKPQELPMLLAAQLHDAAALKKTSDRIAANQQLWEKGVQRTEADHDGTAVHTFSTPFNVDMRLSHAVADDLLLLSLRPEPVADALGARKSKKTFAGRGAPPFAPGHVFLQANDGQLLGALLACIRDELPAVGQKWLPELDRVIASLHGYQATLVREQGGLLLVARSDLGTVPTALLAIAMQDKGAAIVAGRVTRDLDAIGAALDAYHAKHNAYPETLDQLVPGFLPKLVNDRFAPARPYGYTRGRPGPDGRLPDAWLITSVGPDRRPDIPIDQFDPVLWPARLHTQDPAEIAQLKQVLYRFRHEAYPDERKNDDEGDLYRMGGKGLGAAPAPAPVETPRAPNGAPKKEDF